MRSITYKEGQSVVSVATLGTYLKWERKRFMEISDSLLTCQRIIVTPLGISLSGFGMVEAKEIAKEQS
jgi:hypothetical protein